MIPRTSSQWDGPCRSYDLAWALDRPIQSRGCESDLGPYRVRIDNLLSMFLRPDFECLQQLVNFILADRLIMRAIVARRTAPQGHFFRAKSRKKRRFYLRTFSAQCGMFSLDQAVRATVAGIPCDGRRENVARDGGRRSVRKRSAHGLAHGLGATMELSLTPSRFPGCEVYGCTPTWRSGPRSAVAFSLTA